MPSLSPSGPQVPASEDAYRPILTMLHWSAEDDRPSSACFDTDYLSVELCSRTSASDSARRQQVRDRTVFYVVRFNCGAAREIGFDTRDERDDIDPDNSAHAHLYNTWFDQGLSNNQRKKRCRHMSELCVSVTF
jgi:hypothetical protein